MTIPLAQARQVATAMQGGRIQNLFAQSHAKHILQEIDEDPENFPAFDVQLEDKVTFSAYALMAAACAMLEQQAMGEGLIALESAASLLQNAHGPLTETSRESSFHILVASMAFYAAGHYSRAFVSMQQVGSSTNAAQVIGAFLRKDVNILVSRLYEILLQETPQFEEQGDLDEWAIIIAIARSLASVLEFIYTGMRTFLDGADVTLQDALVIAAAGMSPSYWWIVRLLRLMIRNLGDASLWESLPPYFGPELNSGLSAYVRLMAFSTPPIIELWTSQRASLAVALNSANRGGVINLRTSAGKTRVAELAILQTLNRDANAKVIYLAPFRSLAFEVERTLSATFESLGFPVSHLYGGSRVGSVDTELATASSIIIATPEKARALYRANREQFVEVKLIVIDEGHLIGASERYVRNELFVDHLRIFARYTGARILLLSAVLPNTQELAEWVAGDPTAVAASTWKPSSERFGILRWDGSRVRLDWQGDVESFNPSFVTASPLGFGRRRNLFPSNKNEAVAATAVRLASIGPVMIFTARASSVAPLARAAILALGENPENHSWPNYEWTAFLAVCQEELEPDSIEIQAARAGVICHSNRLPPLVRMAMEVLMRSMPPKIIIATTTLGQGVNVGVSSVIVATPFISQQTILRRDFWNICGRAGRAFVDGEGKVLYAIDYTKGRWQIERDENLAEYYFDINSMDRVESGLLHVLSRLLGIAEEAGVSFELLIELVANHDLSMLAGQVHEFELLLDQLDDGLLAIHEDMVSEQPDDSSVELVDVAFRQSLLAIQARAGIGEVDDDDVIRFLQARLSSTLERIPDQTIRKKLVASGLPLSVAIPAHQDLDEFRSIADSYLLSDMSLSSLDAAVRLIEVWVRENASTITHGMPDQSTLDILRPQWLGGIARRVLIEQDPKSDSICKDLYGYQLPWIIHAVSKNLDAPAEQERTDALSQIALLVEIGVPTEMAANLFLAGIHSRTIASELGQLVDIYFGSTIFEVRSNLYDPKFVDTLLPTVSQEAKYWLQLVLSNAQQVRKSAPKITRLKISTSVGVDILHVRMLGEELFLCSLDGNVRVPVQTSLIHQFASIADDPRFIFVKSEDIWQLKIRDPRFKL